MSTIGIPNFNNLLSERDKIRAIQWLFSKIANIESTTSGGYTPPASGIPADDLDSDVQSALALANSALQSHQDISGKQDKLIFAPIDNSSSSSYSLEIGYDYIFDSSLGTFEFILAKNPSDGELSVIFTTGASPAITITSSATIYTQEGFSIDANSTYEMNVKALGGVYYIVLVKMEAAV